MIRIERVAPKVDPTVLIVAGQLTWETTAVLERESRRWLGQRRRLVLELGAVDFIDGVGITLLKRLVRQGVLLRGASPFIALLLGRHGLGCPESPQGGMK